MAGSNFLTTGADKGDATINSFHVRKVYFSLSPNILEKVSLLSFRLNAFFHNKVLFLSVLKLS